MTAPPAQLPKGLEFRLPSGTSGFVGDYIGGGGQGAVYVADYGGRKLALKWYHDHVTQIDVTLRDRITRMVRQGPPDNNFVWPQSLVELNDRPGFGYLMALISSDRQPLQNMFAQPPKRFNASLAVRATACLAIATSFQKLHATGYCYQDINFGGFFIDPQRGTIQICDADNISVDGILGGVYGTRKFMAPEVLRRDAIPSTRTDLYSMAVLFFYVLFNWHPLDGQRERAITTMDAAAEMELYGRHPLFMFDPVDAANGPVPTLHDWIVARWRAMPERLRSLFTRAFTRGLLTPDSRPVENEWRNAFDHLRESVVVCAGCGFEHGVDRVMMQSAPGCVVCRQPLVVPPLLTARQEPIMLAAHRQIYDYQLDTGFVVDDCTAIASVEPHPRDATIIGLQNRQATAWSAQAPGGPATSIAPGKTVRIVDGLSIATGQRSARVSFGAPLPSMQT